ncbi:glutathione S-transferase [Pseudomonas sp.]|uniref:glutathione S-transferase family protein n=1 Tax=Pseudomonas sp. TaxID=306 RepID=UPI0025832D79|nr:glutathione S-transferase [Pseudomonas sp.]
MLKLYGFASSNYYNMAKLALLHKRLAFREVLLEGCQNPQTLAVSARGKVPVLETAEGYLTETDVILGYLEEVYPQRPLLPSGAFDRARVKSMAKEIELYIELPARTCYAQVFFGGRATPQALKDKALRDLVKGFRALFGRATFTPYLAGHDMSLADIYFLYSVDLAREVGLKLFDIDFLAHSPGAHALLRLLALDPDVATVAKDRQQDAQRFIARVNPGLDRSHPGVQENQREASSA